jgi:branched-chain amino acid transport system permease protein
MNNSVKNATRPTPSLRERMRTPQLWVMVAVLVVFALIPLFAELYIVRLATLAAIGSILALSLNLLYGFAGQISFGHGAFYALGAYGAALISVYLIDDMAVGIPLAVLITVVIASLMGAPILRLRDHFLGLATLALGLVVWTILRQWVEVTGGPSGMSLPMPQLFGQEMGPVTYHYFVIVMLALVLLFVTSLVNSKVGWALRALRSDEEAAAAVGINVFRYKVLAFGISAGIAGIGGALYGYLDGYIAPETFGIHASIVILTMVVVGGLGSNIGALLGGAVFMALPNLFVEIQEYQHMIYGLILLGFLLFLPRGFAGIGTRRQ